METVIYTPGAFRISLGGDRYILSILTNEQAASDWYAVAAIYDSICENDRRIKYAVQQTISCSTTETLKEYNPFHAVTEDEDLALYHVENIIFRISVLWDLLAQLCNVIYHTNLQQDKIFYGTYFKKYAQGQSAIQIVQKIYGYISETDEDATEGTSWSGNHAYLQRYRNQMSHRVSPNITSISPLGTTLRPPTMYILHRAVEDYHEVSVFLNSLINDFLTDHKNCLPFGDQKTDCNDT